MKIKEMETLRDLIKGVDTAMLTTVSDEGLVSRPMKAAEYWESGSLVKNIAFMYKRMTGKDPESSDVTDGV